MNARLTTMSAAAIAIALVAAGCGGGGDDSAGVAPSKLPAKNNAFVEQADTMCERAREQTPNWTETYEVEHRSDGLSPAALAASASRAGLLATLKAEIEGVNTAGASIGYEPGLDTVIPEMQAILKLVTQDEKLSTAEIEDAFAPTDAMLREYGVTACLKSD